MDQFVSVRMIQMNGVDLETFQFDYDMTFAVFFMNADKTIYGRYGSRSDMKEAQREISLESLAAALEGALEIHKGYPGNKASVARKQGVKQRYKAPEDYPLLQSKYTSSLDYNGQVAKSCIHCHQVREAQRRIHRDRKQPIPDQLLHPYPMPDTIGLTMDPTKRASVLRVAPGSIAAEAGFKAGDSVAAIDGQKIISIGDIQWALEQTGNAAARQSWTLSNGGSTRTVNVALPVGWRRASPFIWRVTSWDMRRMGFGGMKLDDMTDAERKARGLNNTQLALFAKHVGQYGEHAVAKRAGVRKGDIIIAFDGVTQRATEEQALAHAMRKRMKGDILPITVLRGRQKLDFKIRMQ